MVGNMTKKREESTKTNGAAMTSIEMKHRRVSSAHEVAHALVCVLAGIKFRGIRIFNPGQEPEFVLGQTVSHARGQVDITSKWTLSGAGREMMIVLLAGPAATKKLTRNSSFRLLVLGSGDADYAEALQIATDLFNKPFAKKAVQICERRASRLVEDHWQTILKIAKVLSERGYLSYAEFLRLYEASTASVLSA